MNTNAELIISSEKDVTILPRLVTLIGIFLYMVIFHLPLSDFYNSMRYPTVRLVFFVGYFVVTIFFLLKQMRNREPAAILNQKGIQFKHQGFIPWADIESTTHYIWSKGFTGSGVKKRVVGVHIKKRAHSAVLWQSSWTGKKGLIWAKLFNDTYRIPLSSRTVSNEEIVSFASQYLQQN